MSFKKPEKKIMEVLEACADCDVCRYLMDSNCAFFPELYRLWDKQNEQKEKITDAELRGLVDMCNFCALCPCPNIREDVMDAKKAFIERDGLKLGIRILEDVEIIGKVCGALPRLSNKLLQNRRLGSILKGAIGIHENRKIPEFPEESFNNWLKNIDIQAKPTKPKYVGKRKAAFFAGCTGRYFFPDVPRATVEVLRHNGVDVFFPEQKCCGMPTMLEGDMEKTLKFAQFNIERFSELVEEGYDVVCSCPTCGYMIKRVLSAGAYYSAEYQKRAGGDDMRMIVPADLCAIDSGAERFVTMKKSIFGDILKDEGCFSSISPEKRIAAAENTYDLGQYLRMLNQSGALQKDFGPVNSRAVYYPPCHLREQNIGFPYLDLLHLIPDLQLEEIGGSFNCCGIAGIMGFKRVFHSASIKMGSRLIAKIRKMDPGVIVTDCLSCRLQFSQATSYEVIHPIEMISKAYFNRGKTADS